MLADAHISSLGYLCFNTSILGWKFSWNEKKQNLFIAKCELKKEKHIHEKQCFK